MDKFIALTKMKCWLCHELQHAIDLFVVSGACTEERHGDAATGHLLYVLFVVSGACTKERYGDAAAGHLLYVSNCHLLSSHSTAKGTSRSTCQVQQTNCHSCDWRWS